MSIPTTLTRLHIEIATCDAADDLAEATIAMEHEFGSLPPFARRLLHSAILDRYSALQAARVLS